MNQGTIFSSELSTDDKRRTRKGNKPQTLKTEPFNGECYNCGKRGHMAKDCWADGGGKEGQKPQRKSEQKPKSKKKDKAKVEDVKSSDVEYETDYIDDVYCCDFKLTENVNDTIIIYTDDCDIEICSNHMIVNNAGDKAICSVGNNKIFRAENDYKVFLDSCATGMVIRNKNLVADIRKGAEVRIHPITDGAKSVMVGNLWGDLAHFGKVHYNPNARSNIISEGLLKLRGYSITREEDPEDAVIVTAPDGHITRFVRPVGETRWWCDFQRVEAVNMSTVEENMRKYTKREVEKAKEARELQEKMSFPAPNVMIEMVKRHMDNCPVTIQDIHRAMDIWVQVLQLLRVRRLNRSRVFLARKNSCQGV